MADLCLYYIYVRILLQQNMWSFHYIIVCLNMNYTLQRTRSNVSYHIMNMEIYVRIQIPLTFFIFILTAKYCYGDMTCTQINPILSNSTSLSCIEFPCRSRVEANVRCDVMAGCYGAWAHKNTTCEVSCGICNCTNTAQGFDLVGDIASKIMLTSYEKFVKGNFNAFCYLYLIQYRACGPCW